DLIAEGFSDEVLSERLKRQHRLICAAINSGRINDLRKMGAREDLGATMPPPPPPAPVEVIVPEEQTVVPPMEQPVEQDFAIVHEDDEIVHDEEVTQAEAPVSDIFDMELEDIPSQIWSPPEREETPPPPEPEIGEPEFQES